MTQVAPANERRGWRRPACYISSVFADCNLLVSWRTAPRSFPALMGLYESNYLRLARLAGDLSALSGTRLSTVPGDCDLLLRLHGRSRYTSELLLTYLLPGAGSPPGRPERVPDLTLRLYHDARLLEAHAATTHGVDRELDRRWRRNLLLNKWLEYCAERGHRFAPAQAG